ncbi:MAG: hypothetical protein HOP15_15380, partial [Planctomycetes bacterium]|nr:hypothetical protein [Planctomycetota bacterium]
KGSAEATYNLATALRRLERDAEAAEPFTAAMRLEPAYSADCLAELGAIRALDDDEPGARSLLQQALALEPLHAAALRYIEALDSSGGGTGANRSE